MDKMQFNFKKVGTGKKYWCGRECGCTCTYVRGCYRCEVDKEKCKSYMIRFIAALFSQVGLCGTVVGYTIAGALIFEAIEGPFEIQQKREVQEAREQLVQDLWGVTLDLNIFYPANWSSSVEENLIAFEQTVLIAMREGYDGKDEDYQWSFSGALLFAITVITTIGYGNLAPKTTWGRILTMLYAIVGIPIMLLCLANIGDVLAHSFKYLFASTLRVIRRWKIRRKIRRHANRFRMLAMRKKSDNIRTDTPTGNDVTQSLNNPSNIELEVIKSNNQESNCGVKVPDKEDEDDDIDISKVTVPVTLCLIVLVAYVCLGALIFAVWEKWSFLDGAYFSFITLSTIGFGDFLPGASMVAKGANAQTKLAICGVYLLLGLSLISMCFNLVQEEVARKAKWFGKKIGIIVDKEEREKKRLEQLKKQEAATVAASSGSVRSDLYWVQGQAASGEVSSSDDKIDEAEAFEVTET